MHLTPIRRKIHRAALFLRVDPASILGRDRSRETCDARDRIIWCLRRRPTGRTPSWTQIGDAVDRDHSSVISADRRVSVRIERGEISVRSLDALAASMAAESAITRGGDSAILGIEEAR